MICYQVVTDTITVPEDGTGAGHEFRLAAPTGKVVLSGGWSTTMFDVLESSYPDGSEWVFVFKGRSIAGGYDVDLSVVCL